MAALDLSVFIHSILDAFKEEAESLIKPMVGGYVAVGAELQAVAMVALCCRWFSYSKRAPAAPGVEPKRLNRAQE